MRAPTECGECARCESDTPDMSGRAQEPRLEVDARYCGPAASTASDEQRSWGHMHKQKHIHSTISLMIDNLSLHESSSQIVRDVGRLHTTSGQLKMSTQVCPLPCVAGRSYVAC